MYCTKELTAFTHAIFSKMGMSDADANLAAEVLIRADLRGIDSHGIARLPGYIRLWKSGRLNPNANIKIEHETASTATINGDAGVGLVIAPKAMQIAIEKAKIAGTGWVAVKNSNHFGIAGYHSMLALKQDMIGFAMTNASPLVSPTFSKERLLGTNPISVAIPTGKEAPFVADFATTTAANGKLEILQKERKDVPDGWVQDEHGNPSNNPFAVEDGGSLLPLGGKKDTGSHKGYILGAMVDILSGVLSGANYGPWVPPFVTFLPVMPELVGDGIGHFLGAIRIDAFRPKDEFKKQMDQWITRFKESIPIDKNQRVVIPGEPEREFESIRTSEGLPLSNKVVENLMAVAEAFKVDFPGVKNSTH